MQELEKVTESANITKISTRKHLPTKSNMESEHDIKSFLLTSITLLVKHTTRILLPTSPNEKKQIFMIIYWLSVPCPVFLDPLGLWSSGSKLCKHLDE